MPRTKYPNGAYKSTSKAQDRIGVGLYKVLRDQMGDSFATMSTSLNQVTGECCFTYTFEDDRVPEFVIIVNRRGVILNIT